MSHTKRLAVDVRTLALAASLAATLGRAGVALADEPRKISEPQVLKEPAEVVQVADAFDDDDPFDLHLSLGYESSWQKSQIHRESGLNQTGLAQGGFIATNMNVAEYKQTTSRLLTRADIGIYKDIALVLRVPIILSDDRQLNGTAGSAGQQTVALGGAPGEQLFSLPFKSPTRSGIEYLAVGIDAAIMNQARDATKPTWLFGFEGRFDVSEPMHACNPNTGGLNQPGPQVKCAAVSDINRSGRAGDVPLEGNFNGERKPGVGRGTTGLEIHTIVSRRVKYIEPYGGFRALLEFQNDSSDYGAVDLKGSLVNHPPFRGTMVVGMNVIPYEVRDQFQRLTLDFRFTGTYVSEGRDYSELFDALGSSDAPSLRNPNFSQYKACDNAACMNQNPPVTSIVDPNSQKVYFTGLTDVQQHGVYMLGTEVTYQAGEYVKFRVGGGYTLTQGHFLTFDQACNPNFSSDLGQSGPCHSAQGVSNAYTASGIPNPNFRRTINDPGLRFKVDDGRGLDAWLGATVMF